jgi:small-conductance mechanosensitive channel
MGSLSDWFDSIFNGIALEILWTLLTIIIASLIFYLIFKILRKLLLKVAKTKKQLSHVTLFLNIIKYFFIFILILILISSYFGSWLEFGLTAGLITAAIGWALQKPITGMAAWVMLAVKRPFGIGDRVIISDIKGDILDITLSHIYLHEVGGTIMGEEQSGRLVLIPNSILFEKEIINYSKRHDYILDEVISTITFESNLSKAEKLVKDATRKVLKPLYGKFPKKIPREPWIRLKFKKSGIDITVRYVTVARMREAIATDVTREIFTRIRKAKDVNIAYPHMEVLLSKKGE